jgi:short-subunit dehydrogenase
VWFSKSNFPVSGKLAVIIGASQGVGADLAAKLYEKDCSVILVARTESKLRAQVDRIETAIGIKENVKVSYLTCDVSNYQACQKLWHDIMVEQNQDPDIIMCCAGSSIPKLFQDLTEYDISSGITTNYNTAINVVHTGFKQILDIKPGLKQKHRHVVFFASVVSFFPFIGYAQYAPLKAAIQSLSLILRQELGPYNFRVSCIFPGNFQSEGFEEEQKTKPEITKTIEGPSSPIPGPECADIIIDQLGKGYDTITTDFVGWVLGCSVLGVLPRNWSLFQIIVSFVFLIVSPIATWSIYRDVVKYFKTHAVDQDVKPHEE